MDYFLSTSYFAGKGMTPTQMAERTLELGFQGVELGYFMPEDSWDELKQALAERHLTVSSVHAFAPVPIGMPQLGPEVFAIAHPVEQDRQEAIFYLRRTLNLAKDAGARAIVVHAGRVDTEPRLFCKDEAKLRARHAPRNAAALAKSLEVLLPEFEAAGVALALENLPGMEAFPNATEFAEIHRDFPAVRAWYDIGHGELKERGQEELVTDALTLMGDAIVGCHIHDVQSPMTDHCAPGTGEIDFKALQPALGAEQVLHIFEPRPRVTLEDLASGFTFIKGLWG